MHNGTYSHYEPPEGKDYIVDTAIKKLNEITLSTKVTRINGNWHCRLIRRDGIVHDEMACDNRMNIGFCFAEMLRWVDKLGWCNNMASDSRRRQKSKQVDGKIWYKKDLPI